MSGRGGEDLLEAVDVGGEGGDQNPSRARREQFVKCVADHLLGEGEPLPLDVGRVGEQQQNPFLAVLRQARDVGRLVVDR